MLAAVIVCVLLAGLAVFQLLLAAGRPLGRFAWGGQHDVLPRRLRIGSAVSVVVYGVIAAVVLQAAGGAEVFPGAVADVGIWVVTGYFALGVPVNAISRSRPERLVMTPVVLVLAVGSLVVALE
jgi:predicted Co/Zn/Cd cation transporter (cation efflux family)